jgi:hypothetical protein
MAISKKKVIKSLENLSDELIQMLNHQYPNGYEANITRITNAKREPIFVFPLETEDTTYLVKVPVTRNSDGEYDVESKSEDEFEKQGDGFDDSDGFEGGEEESDSDYEEGEGGRKGREASYDPDFDN